MAAYYYNLRPANWSFIEARFQRFNDTSDLDKQLSTILKAYDSGKTRGIIDEDVFGFNAFADQHISFNASDSSAASTDSSVELSTAASSAGPPHKFVLPTRGPGPHNAMAAASNAQLCSGMTSTSGAGTSIENANNTTQQ